MSDSALPTPRASLVRTRFGLAVALGLWLMAGTATVAAAGSPQKKLEPYALLAGTVWSPAGQAVPGVKVKIRRAGDKKAGWELVTNSRGEFVQRLPAATADYIVWVERKGHKGPMAERTLHFTNDERLDIGLHLTE